MKFCQHCGARLDDGATFCSTCGKRVDGNNSAASFGASIGSSLTRALDFATDKLDAALTWVAKFLTQNDPAAPSYVIWSILATVFVCQPVGLVAIYYSARCESRKKQGDLQGAAYASKSAKSWIVAAVASGIFLGPAFALFLRLRAL